MIQDQRCRNFISGLIAGFISVTVCNPLDITRTRLNIMVKNILVQNSPSHNSSKYQSFSHTMKTILKEEGFKGFYVGLKLIINQDIGLTQLRFHCFIRYSFLSINIRNLSSTIKAIINIWSTFWLQQLQELLVTLSQILFGQLEQESWSSICIQNQDTTKILNRYR